VKQSLEKQPKLKAGHNIKTPDFIGANSRRIVHNSGKSPGNPMVEVATPNGTINQPRERIKTD
jgi:hypothetical protein